MRKTALLLMSIVLLSSCHHATLEDKAKKIADDYTERYCPTPEQEMTITDSITFDRDSKTFNYYYTLTKTADNADAIAKVKGKLDKSLIANLKENTSMKVFKDASYNFNYVFYSQKTGNILYHKKLTAKDYKKK